MFVIQQTLGNLQIKKAPSGALIFLLIMVGYCTHEIAGKHSPVRLLHAHSITCWKTIPPFSDFPSNAHIIRFSSSSQFSVASLTLNGLPSPQSWVFKVMQASFGILYILILKLSSPPLINTSPPKAFWKDVFPSVCLRETED